MQWEAPVAGAFEEEVLPELIAARRRGQAQINVADCELLPFLHHPSHTAFDFSQRLDHLPPNVSISASDHSGSEFWFHEGD